LDLQRQRSPSTEAPGSAHRRLVPFSLFGPGYRRFHADGVPDLVVVKSTPEQPHFPVPFLAIVNAEWHVRPPRDPIPHSLQAPTAPRRVSESPAPFSAEDLHPNLAVPTKSGSATVGFLFYFPMAVGHFPRPADFTIRVSAERFPRGTQAQIIRRI